MGSLTFEFINDWYKGFETLNLLTVCLYRNGNFSINLLTALDWNIGFQIDKKQIKQ